MFEDKSSGGFGYVILDLVIACVGVLPIGPMNLNMVDKKYLKY